MTETDQSTVTTIEGITVSGVHELEGGTVIVSFSLTHPDGGSVVLRVPEVCVYGRWPVPIGTECTVEYRTGDLEAGQQRGYQSVTVLG